MLTIGTGVGGGLVIDGELVRGGFGMGGEVGHITMVPGGVPCGCGNLGCLESYGSGSALVRVSRELAGSDPESREGTGRRGPAETRPGSPARSSRRPPRTATRSRSRGSPSSATGSVRASPRSPPCSTPTSS